MTGTRDRESIVRISLVDVMYGVILAYGFNFFDKAKDFTDYFRFFFSYAVFMVDWIYVHRLYWGWEYNNKFLVLDIGILFAISRMLFTSTSNSPYYFLWLAALFVFYIVWDFISKKYNLSSQYDWRYSIAGDIFAGIIFFVLWILSITGTAEACVVYWTVVPSLAYIIAFISWFKRAPEELSIVTT